MSHGVLLDPGTLVLSKTCETAPRRCGMIMTCTICMNLSFRIRVGILPRLDGVFVMYGMLACLALLYKHHTYTSVKVYDLEDCHV